MEVIGQREEICMEAARRLACMAQAWHGSTACLQGFKGPPGEYNTLYSTRQSHLLMLDLEISANLFLLCAASHDNTQCKRLACIYLAVMMIQKKRFISDSGKATQH